MKMTKSSVPVTFAWTLLEAGQFKPVTLVPQDVLVVVDVPLQGEFVGNAEVILNAQVTGQGTGPKPILTVKGMQYILNHVQDTLATVDVDVTNQVDQTSDYELIE